MKLVEMKCQNCGAKLEVNSELDKINCNFCGAEILIDDEASELRRIEDVKLESRKKNHEQTLKEQEDCEELEYKKKFKKSFFKKILIFFIIMAMIGIVTAFANDATTAGIISIVQIVIFTIAMLMGYSVIKEPFKYLHVIVGCIGIVLAFVYLNAYNNAGSSSKCESFKWSNINYHERIPEPEKVKGSIHSNSTSSVWFTLCGYSLDDYYEYRDLVKSKGFTYDVDDYTNSYDAYDSDGYRISISLYESKKELSIYIDPPSDETYNEPEETEEEEKEKEEKEESSSNTSSGLRSEFKNSMDKYEKLIDEYVSFMKKYKNNPSDAALLKDYASYMEKYNEAVEAFSKWESEDLNDEELKYYIEVQNRVNKKLLEIS